MNRDTNSFNEDEEGVSLLTMSYTVSETYQTRSKASHQYNLTKGSKNTQDNLEFTLSPSESSLPKTKNSKSTLNDKKVQY